MFTWPPGGQHRHYSLRAFACVFLCMFQRELAEYEKNKPSESVLLKKEEVERQNIQLREVNTLLTEQTQKLEKVRILNLFTI